MVESCSAVKCYNRRNKNEKMKFHRFPTDPNRRKLWLNAVRRVNFIPSKTTVICEKHFTSEDYELNVYGNRMLKKSAVPSVFEFHGHIKKEHKQQGILKRKQYEELTSEETEKILNITETEVIEAPENCSCADDGNILPAGPSNIARNPGVLQSSEPSSANRTNNFRPNNRLQVQIGQNFANICKRSKREPVYVGETEVIEAPENCSLADYGNILSAGPSNRAQNPGVLQSSEPSSTNICKRSKRQPVYFGDFKLSDLDNTQFRMRFWKVAQETVDKYRKLIKYNQCQIRRQGKKIKSLKILLDELLKEKKISAAQSLVLKENLSETQKHLIFGHLKKGKSNEYSPELRCFALTLHSYSSSAYNYVRKMYGKTVLPHPRTLSKWHSVVDGTPAYSAEALLN
uniref:THAP domain-containing protein 4-like n=1 Tax=Diabrotica virgifera virgifera TaxID=50390 RepID=A0A6P7GMT3_DIAVI